MGAPLSHAMVICRQASDTLRPGNKRGWRCRVCSKELQVSPEGQRQIAQGGLPLCNSCGFQLADDLKAGKTAVEWFFNQGVVDQEQEKKTTGGRTGTDSDPARDS